MPLDFEKIRRLREQKGWSQEEAARASGLSTRQRWNDIESGRKASITINTLEKIAEALGVSARELLTEAR